MNEVVNQCHEILNLIEESKFKEENNYSIVRIKNAIKQILNATNANNIEKIKINIQSLSRNFVDDTGDYSNVILKELETLSKHIENIV